MKFALALVLAMASTPPDRSATVAGAGASEPETVAMLSEMAARHPNRPPVADAGPDVSVRPGEGVELVGAASFDPDGDALSFHWVQVAGPRVALEPSARVANPAFEAPRIDGRALVFELRVSDPLGHASVDTVVVSVSRQPAATQGDEPLRGEVSLARRGR